MDLNQLIEDPSLLFAILFLGFPLLLLIRGLYAQRRGERPIQLSKGGLVMMFLLTAFGLSVVPVVHHFEAIIKERQELQRITRSTFQLVEVLRMQRRQLSSSLRRAEREARSCEEALKAQGFSWRSREPQPCKEMKHYLSRAKL